MVQADLYKNLPTSDGLPDSDDTPVDDEDQNLLPNYLLFIYNPEYWGCDKHQPFEVYKLIGGKYHLQRGEPYWMSEVGLAIGRAQGLLGGEIREVLTWFDNEGNRYPSAEEKALEFEAQAQAYQTQAQQERQARLGAIQPLHQRGLSTAEIADILSLSVDEVEQAIRPDKE